MLRFWDGALLALAILAAGILAAISTAITLNVILRSTGLPVLYGTLDAVEYGLLLACFLGTPWVLARRGHVQVDLIMDSLPTATKRRFGQITSVIGALLCLTFAYYGFQAMGQSMARGAMIRTSFVIPEWWTLGIVPSSMVLCALEFVRQAIMPPPVIKDLGGL